MSAAAAKGQLQEARRAEAESKRAMAAQKKEKNKQRDLQIMLAKQEQERARTREAGRKAKQQAREAKALKALPREVGCVSARCLHALNPEP